MKQGLLFFVLFSYSSIFAQEATPEKALDGLRLKIEQSQKGEKLKWMDSLSNFIVRKTKYESDSIVKETVRYALELDSLRVATWHTANLIYFQNNIRGDLKEGNTIFMDFLEKAKESENHNALAKYYLEGADNFFFLEDQKTAVVYYDLAIVEAEKAGNEDFVGIAKLYKGGTLSFLGEFSDASQVLQEASQIFQKARDTFHIIGAKNSLSILYSQNAFFDEARIERDEAILLAEKIESFGHLTSFYYNAATDARKQGIDEDRIVNLKAAINANKKTRNPELNEATLLAGLVIAYSDLDNLPEAEKYIGEIERSDEETWFERNKEPYLDASKNLAFAKKQYDLALKYGLEHLVLKRQGTQYEEIQAAERFMASAYEAIGNKEAAYEHFKKHTTINDSIGNIRKIKVLSYYQTLYETEKRDLKIKAQQSDIALLDSRNSQKSQLLLFGGLGLFLIFGLIVMARSINEAKRRQRMNKEFSQNLINAQEEERTRVARELHDSVGQKLMLLTKQTKKLGNPEMESLAGSTLDELRSISKGLHPAALDKLGITAAIVSMVNEVDANTNIFFTNEIENIDNLLSKEGSLHFFRILQEILNNMVKHADAKVASVTIEKKDKTIQAIIKDNGRGFEVSEKRSLNSGLGMKTLMERANILKSKLNVKSKPNHGTTIELIIPTYND
ncbi:MAG: signal transduction histidine kinase [Ulvibacter sp.]